MNKWNKLESFIDNYKLIIKLDDHWWIFMFSLVFSSIGGFFSVAEEIFHNFRKQIRIIYLTRA